MGKGRDKRKRRQKKRARHDKKQEQLSQFEVVGFAGGLRVLDTIDIEKENQDG